MIDPFAASEVSFVIVAIAFKTTHAVGTVSTFLYGSQQMGDIHLASAGPSLLSSHWTDNRVAWNLPGPRPNILNIHSKKL